MNDRERFAAIMDYRPFDRLPVWYFGFWTETLQRWHKEGLSTAEPPHLAIPAATGMDPDWEQGMWECHGLVNTFPISGEPERVLEETEESRTVRTPLGAILRSGKQGSSIPQHVEEALKPTRESWTRFRAFLDPNTPGRRPADWAARAEALDRSDRVRCFVSSLYGFARDWMGVEAISLLAYDDPALLEEIVAHQADFYMALFRPILEKVRFDFAYIFEDCCFSNGPLLSPNIYRSIFDRHYRRMIGFYRDCGVKHILLDSDGKVDALVPLWLDSGVDILFPIEVGTWRGNPAAFRKQYGMNLRMMGGVNKHVIPRGEAAIRAELEPLAPLVREGGFIPLPDHRIPPDCSLDNFRDYVRLFKEIFALDAARSPRI